MSGLGCGRDLASAAAVYFYVWSKGRIVTGNSWSGRSPDALADGNSLYKNTSTNGSANGFEMTRGTNKIELVIRQIVASNIRMAREHAEMSQRDLCELANIGQAYLSV
jgi:hypothetical protein